MELLSLNPGNKKMWTLLPKKKSNGQVI